MAANPCMAFFEANESNHEKVKELIKTGQGDNWAAMSASTHSPGIVEPHEGLARQVMDPTHWDSSANALKLGLFDDVTSRGMSLSRLTLIDEAEVIESAHARAETTGKRFVGLLITTAQEIVEIMRSADVGGSGAVFDTALADDVSHADACQTRGGRKEGREIRYKLYEKLKDSCSLAKQPDNGPAPIP